MGFKQVMSASREMIMGAVFTGIALVIANSWGTFLTTSTSKVVNMVRCSKYKKSKKDNITPLPGTTEETQTKKEICESEVTVWGTFWGAIITSIFLTIVIICIMVLRGKKHESSRRLTGSSTSWQGNFDKAVYD